ncbi:MAG: hypothetical protein QF582_17240 [Alphaproteobacteria bacterium]|nr:hypothetical protein [Alphaproteobacteria bacterium]
MTKPEKPIIVDPKYDPPYPQGFYRFWPRHALKTLLVIVITFVLIVVLACLFQIPTDVNMPPLPDDGAYIPGPEWYLMLIFQPFWYLAGDLTAWRPAGTFWLPLAILLSLLFLPPLFARRRQPGARMALLPKVIFGLAVFGFWAMMTVGLVGSGYPAKTNGCLSCHNPMMGARQAQPPADIGEYYRSTRKRQIVVGKYRVGQTVGASGSYKDANWQLRHYYEPTMTW